MDTEIAYDWLRVWVDANHPSFQNCIIDRSDNVHDEMNHVTEFSDVIRGLGGEPITDWHDIPFLTEPRKIIEKALEMEVEVVENYTKRIKQAEEIGGSDGQWLEIFLEKQIEHSREDVDHFRQILRGTCHHKKDLT
jgi:bacterioferritin (cytochrome b1)